IGNWDKQDVKLDTAFLKGGTWQAEIFEDGVNADRDATDYRQRTSVIDAGATITVRLMPGGGWTARLTRK
ncbi:MAG: glycoside hydrolase family 97 C-terminal domain-containing protein, partial [Kiritimatiellae bacterium]|nr:glycoside hydrolase family 97 C-terminal domain-containing protein [Kiritimatiellia bacterium]